MTLHEQQRTADERSRIEMLRNVQPMIQNNCGIVLVQRERRMRTPPCATKLFYGQRSDIIEHKHARSNTSVEHGRAKSRVRARCR